MKSQRRDKEVDADLYSTHLLDELLDVSPSLPRRIRNGRKFKKSYRLHSKQ